MSNLFSSLTSAARALDAQRYGMDVAGQNIANINTPGYSRRTVDLAAVPPEGADGVGRGVDVVQVRAMRDRLLDVRLQMEVPSEKYEAARAEALSIVEAALGKPGESIDASLEEFFDAFARLSHDPTSPIARQEVVLRGESLASSFRDIAGRLETAGWDANRQIGGAVDDINSLLKRIASLNYSIAAAGSTQGTLHARDEQALLVRTLAELVDVRTLERADGGVDISLGSGRPLVVGQTAYEITTTPAPPSGYLALGLNGSDITGAVSGGKLGGLLSVRDTAIPDYMSRLDTLAYETVQRINALHSAGYDQTGAAAGDFFAFDSPLSGVSGGAAAALTVHADVASDPGKVAAGSNPDAGNNETAAAIARVRDERLLDSGTTTLAEAWGQLVYRVGRDVKDAQSERDSREQIVRQVDMLRDQISGVSLDEEAMHLLKFQRAYEANARFFQIVDEALQTLLRL